jgi:uncharacterized membrane protein
MNNKELRQKLKDLEKTYQEMPSLQYQTNKLYMEIINDFNEKTGRYNIIIAFLTVVIAVLTLVMVIKMFIR